ncbi:MAG TPA: hypothetical protein VK589_10640 [Chryseolinea sp.]|nr:hypothetical protein [Chryseolinea sp.]
MTTLTIVPTRTMLYFKKYAFENRKAYLFLCLAVAAFLVLWLGVQLNFTNPYLFSERVQAMYYFITLFLAGCLSSGMLFSELGSKPRAIHYLLIPASTLEKFLCGLFFGVFIFFIACSGIFYIIDYIAVQLANYKYGTNWEVINLLTLEKYPNAFMEGPLTDIFYFFFPIQALFILCSVFFKKHALFKAIVGMGLLWVAFVALFLILHRLLPIGKFNDTIRYYEIVEADGDNKLIVLPALLTTTVIIFSKFLLTPLLWTVSYLKLKEKEL